MSLSKIGLRRREAILRTLEQAGKPIRLCELQKRVDRSGLFISYGTLWRMLHNMPSVEQRRDQAGHKRYSLGAWVPQEENK